MAERQIYLRIERIPDYSPVAPQDKTPPTIKYKHDGMRNHAHEDGTTREDLFTLMDSYLYKAKSMGKNIVCHSSSQAS